MRSRPSTQRKKYFVELWRVIPGISPKRCVLLTASFYGPIRDIFDSDVRLSQTIWGWVMTIFELGALGEFVSSVVVLVTLVYLAVKQNVLFSLHRYKQELRR